MRNKLTSLSEAIARVPDNAVIAPGGNTLHRSPTAAVHELILYFGEHPAARLFQPQEVVEILAFANRL